MGGQEEALRDTLKLPVRLRRIIPAELILVKTGSGNPFRSSEGHASSWPWNPVVGWVEPSETHRRCHSSTLWPPLLLRRIFDLGGTRRSSEGHPQTPGKGASPLCTPLWCKSACRSLPMSFPRSLSSWKRGAGIHFGLRRATLRRGRGTQL